MTNPVQAVTTKAGRYYLRDGKKYMSVTTALKAIPKDALMYWSAREVATEAVRMIDEGDYSSCPGIVLGYEGPYVMDAAAAIKHLKGAPWIKRDNAGAIGDEVHGWAERIMAGETPDPEWLNRKRNNDVQKRVKHFLQWLEDFTIEPIHVEATIYNDTHEYSGSCDLMAYVTAPAHGWDREPVVIDFKTSKSIYGEVALQAVAYKNGEYILGDDGTKHPMPELRSGAVLHIHPNGYTFRELDVSNERYKNFLAALYMKRGWIDKGANEALLDIIPVTKEAAWNSAMGGA